MSEPLGEHLQRRRATAWVATGLALGAALVAAWLWRPQSRLGEVAIPIRLPFPLTNLIAHIWLGEQELLVMQAAEEGEVEALRANLKTGAFSRIPGIRETLVSGGETSRLEQVDVSADGQWLLLFGQAQTNFQMGVVRTDGTGGHSYKLGSGAVGFCWLPDSRTWMEARVRGGMGEATIHSVDSAETWTFPTVLTNDVNPVGPLEKGQVLFGWHDPANPDTVLLAMSNPTNFALTRLPRPSGVPRHLRGSYTMLQVNRQGNLLAGTAVPARRLTGPVMSFFGISPPAPTTLWVSRPDGTQWRSLGSLPPGEDIEEFRWTPAGNLSFARRDRTNGVSLWRVVVR